MADGQSAPRTEAAEHIKAMALQLFAQRGVDGVTVRQIAEAAGQKNHAAVTYYFGSKEALVREVIVDGARAIDERRNRWLDEAERAGGPHSVLEVIEGLVRTSVSPHPPSGDECYNRFIVVLGIANRSLLEDALGGRWTTGYQRALVHIRRLLHDVPVPEVNRRLLFMGAAIGGILAAREGELADTSRPHPTWGADATLSSAATAVAAMVQYGGRDSF
jgi:AcrR family transcriptional regulator